MFFFIYLEEFIGPLKEQDKVRLETFLPKDGLVDEETFFIRSTPHHARGGVDDSFEVLITKDFKFNCSMRRVIYGMKRNFKFFFTGNLPAQIISYLKIIASNDLFQELSDNMLDYAMLNSYEGAFDISFKAKQNSDTKYINFKQVETFSKKDVPLDDSLTSKTLKNWLWEFQILFLTWLDSLSFAHPEMLQKGLFSIEIEYD